MTYGMIAATALMLSVAASGARADEKHFTAVLDGADEVPANLSAGHGALEADLSPITKVLRYRVTYSGLTGPAVAAHFHGPAAKGVNAGVMIPMVSVSSPITGETVLTDPQISDLKAGRWYFNIHTQANPGGEIRGQVNAAP